MSTVTQYKRLGTGRTSTDDTTNTKGFAKTAKHYDFVSGDFYSALPSKLPDLRAELPYLQWAAFYARNIQTSRHFYERVLKINQG